MKSSERGAALLTVLLLVSVMAVLSAAALERLRVSTRLAANAGAIDQARAYAMAAEHIALSRINTLVQADQARTPIAGGWNGRETNLPLPGGMAVAVVGDGGNCFNLNSVVTGQVGQPLVVRPAGVTQFADLMQLLGIGPGDAQRVAASLADWIDSDGVEQPGGAEDAAYATKETPYKTGNTLLIDVSELRAVAGVTPEIYEKLRPWVCALPVTDPSLLNVNTLNPEQAPLLAMLSPDTITPDRARALIAARPPNGWSGTFEFWQPLSAEGLVPGEGGQAQAGVKTRWFTLSLRVMLGDSEVEETALIDAAVLPAKLVRRSWGGRVSTLVLFIAPDDRLAGWWIVVNGEVAGRGDADASLPDLPDRVVAIAPADAITVHVAELGGLATQQARTAARLLATEMSIAPIETQHVAAGEADGADRSVAVIGKGRMAAWLGSLQVRGIDPDAILAAPLLLPRPEQGYVRARVGAETVLRGRSGAFAEEPELTGLLVGDAPVEDIDAEEYILASLDAPELDLRQGEFAKRRRFQVDWPRVRRMAGIGAGIAATTLLIAIVQIVRYSHGADVLQAQAEQVARTAVPDAGGSPVAALEAQVAARRGAGLGFTTTAGALFAAAQSVPNVELASLTFDPDGLLRATVLAPGAPEAEALRTRLRATGLTVEATPFTAESGRIRGEFRIGNR